MAVLCLPGDVIPGDGEVIEGVASVDESAITGESAPVIRESGGDRSAVTGGTKVLSDHLVIRITANPGETFLDRMIALVEGASRQKTPNEIALTILLSGLTIIFLFAVATLEPFAVVQRRHGHGAGAHRAARVSHSHHDRRAALRDRHCGHGPHDPAERDRDERALRGGRRRREHAAARQDRHDHARQSPGGGIHPVPGVALERLADRAQFASLPDETPEGRSIVVLAKEKFNLRGRAVGHDTQPQDAEFVPFSAMTRMSGVNQGALLVRKGASDAVARWVTENGGSAPGDLKPIVDRVAREGGTPLVVAERESGARARARRDLSQGRGEGRHPRALRPAARDGHSHRDDHRRQSAHRRGDRARGGRR